MKVYSKPLFEKYHLAESEVPKVLLTRPPNRHMSRARVSEQADLDHVDFLMYCGVLRSGAPACREKSQGGAVRFPEDECHLYMFQCGIREKEMDRNIKHAARLVSGSQSL
jgi:hypothetical protein